MKQSTGDKIKVPAFNIGNGFHTTEAKSRVMRKIKGANNQSEQLLRKALWDLGIRYRKNYSKLPGKPDIAITRSKLAIFIDGEFWHGYDWDKSILRIKTNKEYWIPKIERNMQRDKSNNEVLIENGWTVLRFWEKEIQQNFGMCLKKILNYVE